MGGIENHLSRQLRLFSEDEYEVAVILLFAKSKILLKDILPKHVRVYEFQFRNIYDVQSLRALTKLLRKLSPDIVVTSAFDANTVFRVLKPLVGYVAIPRLHNLYLDQPLRLRIVDRILSWITPTIVAVSQGVAAFAAKSENIPLRKFTVIPNGIDLQEVKEFTDSFSADDQKEIRQRFGLGESKIILNVSRLRGQKNLVLAIQSFAHFKSQYDSRDEFKFVIVGDGGERSNLEQEAVDCGVGGSVVFVGLQKNSFPFYMIADIFLLTSIREGFPNVLLESMAFGVPFVSTKVPGATEAIVDGENGFLAEDDPEDLAGKISFIANASENEREHYKASCLQTAVKYSMEENVRKYKELFARLAKK